MNLARYEKRIFSYIIDFILTLFPSITLGTLLIIFKSKELPWYFTLLICLIVEWISFTFFMSLTLYIFKGFTIGSAIFGIRIVHKDLSRVTYRESFLRNINMGLFILVIINVIYMLSVHTEVTIFDRLSNTLSVDWRHRDI